jgi:hypothetical protein
MGREGGVAERPVLETMWGGRKEKRREEEMVLGSYFEQ